MRVLVAGYQHETNTFAPTRADWAAFNRGDAFPAFVHGRAMLAQLSGVNLPVGGFIDAAHTLGWQLVRRRALVLCDRGRLRAHRRGHPG